jgi:molybdenum cofactor cytidylyltransferase
MIDPADIGSPIRNGPVVGVLLAAGVSQRYGERNKLLVDVAGEPMVRRAARTLTESNIATVVAVVGHDADAVRAALSGVDLEIVENPDYKAGQATSLEVGTRAAASAEAAAASYAHGDMPRVATTTPNTLVRAYRGATPRSSMRGTSTPSWASTVMSGDARSSSRTIGRHS